MERRGEMREGNKVRGQGVWEEKRGREGWKNSEGSKGPNYTLSLPMMPYGIIFKNSQWKLKINFHDWYSILGLGRISLNTLMEFSHSLIKTWYTKG